MPELSSLIALILMRPCRVLRLRWQKGVSDRSLFFALCMCLSLPLSAQAVDGMHVYSGTLGKMPIVLELDFNRT